MNLVKSKKHIILFYFLIIFLTLFFTKNNLYANYTGEVSANSSVLMNAETGDILYEKNADSGFSPASTTKVMTFLIVMENCDLMDMVTVGENPPKAIGSSIGLIEGEIISVNDLLHGLLMESGNDCAVALAEHVAGSESAFADLMNKKATELNLKNTFFKNASGLFEEGHIMSASALAIITKSALKYDIFSEISKTVLYKMQNTNLVTQDRYINLGNKMLQPFSPNYYEYAIAGKTGYTTESLFSYVSVAKKDDMTLITTLINDPSSNFYATANSLFEYGFNNFSLKKIFSKGDLVFNYPTDNGYSKISVLEDLYMVLDKDTSSSLKVDHISSPSLKDTDFEGSLFLNNGKEAKIKLHSERIEQNTTKAFLDYLREEKKEYLFIFAIILSLIFTLFLLKIKVSKKKNIKRQKKINTRR